MTEESPLIEMNNVSRVYQMGRVEVPALRGVDLRIRRGEFTSIVGPSGSGKTTLLNVIGCLDLPSGGTYYLQGRDVATLSDSQLSRLRGEGIGFVFQDYSLLRRFSALRNVELPRYYARGRGDRKRALSLLTQVGLSERADHKPTELSGGEQQRVAVARALMNDPFLILADEPTGNLDSASGQELMRLLARLNQEQGLTVLIVTHDPSVSALTRRVIHMRDGQIVADEAQG
jgi:putative ABC transport system ATP-binding protein